jgi:hypothetical protein
MSPPCASQLEQLALDRADAGLGDIAELGRELAGALGAIREHRLQIVEVEQQQPFLVGDVEGDVEHAFLRLVEVHQPREQQRPHLRNGRAIGWPCSPNRSQKHRIVAIAPVGIADLLRPRGEDLVRLRGRRSGHAEPGQVALHVGDEAPARPPEKPSASPAGSRSCRCRSRRRSARGDWRGAPFQEIVLGEKRAIVSCRT